MASLEQKTCAQCGVLQPLANFSKQGKYLRSACKSCEKIRRAGEYSRLSPEKKELYKRKAAAKRYNITLEEYDALMEGIDHCPICLTTEPEGVGWVIDHDHKTGKVRGVLCSECNLGIGKLKDSIANLTRAQLYLEVTDGIA